MTLSILYSIDNREEEELPRVCHTLEEAMRVAQSLIVVLDPKINFSLTIKGAVS